MKSFLSLIAALSCGQVLASKDLYQLCKLNQAQFERFRETINLQQKNSFEMIEEADSVAFIFKSPEFQTIEAPEADALKIKYNAAQRATAIALQTKLFSALIQPLEKSPFADKVLVSVSIKEEEADQNGSYANRFQKQQIVLNALAIEKATAEFDKEKGTIKLMIPKISTNTLILETAVPINIVKPQGI